MIEIPPLDVRLMWQIFTQQERLGTQYGYGAKAPNLDAMPGEFSSIDCSGEFRYLIHRASYGAITPPDGSQAQREWLEESSARPIARYDGVLYADESRLFVGCIRPYWHGCGSVGHIFMINRRVKSATPHTIESHGGGGCSSRPWNAPVLLAEVYSVFELQTLGNRR